MKNMDLFATKNDNKFKRISLIRGVDVLLSIVGGEILLDITTKDMDCDFKKKSYKILEVNKWIEATGDKDNNLYRFKWCLGALFLFKADAMRELNKWSEDSKPFNLEDANSDVGLGNSIIVTADELLHSINRFLEIE